MWVTANWPELRYLLWVLICLGIAGGILGGVSQVKLRSRDEPPTDPAGDKPESTKSGS
jgi:hypothetical protein